MGAKTPAFPSIDEYIASVPADLQGTLEEMRAAIRAAAPEAEERISYGMPAFYQEGVLVYFAAFKHHIGFYPTMSGIAAFTAELSGYANDKGTVRFPNDKPIPLDLVRRVVRFRVKENLEKAAERKNRKRG